MSSKYKNTHLTDQEMIEKEAQRLYYSTWTWRYHQTIHFLHCSKRIFCIWFTCSLLFCLLYALILYFSIIGNGTFIPGENNLPFFHVPKQYNITLKFDDDYSKSTLRFTGTTRILFESTIVTPNFFINAGENLEIKQLYFERYPGGDTFSAIKTGFDSNTQMQGYVINHVFEDKGQYVAVFDFEGQLFPANADRSRPLRIVANVENAGVNSYAIIHATEKNATFGMRYMTPSFDTNSYPARVHLKIQHFHQFSAISNMKVSNVVNISNILVESIFEESVALFPSQVAFAVVDLTSLTKTNCQENLRVSVHYSSSNIVDSTSPSRLLQLTAESGESNDAIGKVDGVVLPAILQTSLPGILFLNQQDALSAGERLSDKIQLQDNC